MKLSCNVARDLLPLYHDGVCSDESRALVEAHLGECAECGAMLKELRGEIDVPHESPDDQAVLKKLGKNMKRAWIKGAAAVLAVVLVVFAGWYGWWYIDEYRVYQQFAEGHEPVVNNSMDAHGNTVLLYEVDEDGEILGPARNESNVYMWSEGGYDFYVTVPRYPGDMGMLYVSETMKPIPRNITPGQEIHTWLNFGREEYDYYVGVEVTTRTQIPGEIHLKTEIVTKYVMLDKNLNQIYPEYMDEETIADQAAFYEEYNVEIMRIVQAAQEQWPFLAG